MDRPTSGPRPGGRARRAAAARAERPPAHRRPRHRLKRIEVDHLLQRVHAARGLAGARQHHQAAAARDQVAERVAQPAHVGEQSLRGRRAGHAAPVDRLARRGQPPEHRARAPDAQLGRGDRVGSIERRVDDVVATDREVEGGDQHCAHGGVDAAKNVRLG